MDYNDLLDKLRMGEIEEFQVEPDQFILFYKVWRDYQYQNAIKGIAGHDGLITYRRANIAN